MNGHSHRMYMNMRQWHALDGESRNSIAKLPL